MKREPSIHITKSDLIKVLEKLATVGDAIKIADKIFHIAKPYSIHTRTITVSTERMEKKAKKLIQSSRHDADLLSKLIYNRRQKIKHQGISPIKVASKDWGMLKEVTAHALNFTNEFKLTRRYGFLKYVEVGLSRMKKFNLSKFLPMYQEICERYQALIEIEKDDDSEMTNQIYKIYARWVIEYTGLHDILEELPERYVWFVRAREQARNMNVAVNVYMQAQFEGLDFAKGIPYPSQLVGLKATERVIRYCYKEGIKIKGNEV